jgi:Holliday junction resolvasome RuvABC endonuclease subunit
LRLKSFGPGYTQGSNLYIGIDQSYSGFAITAFAEDNTYKTTVARFETRGPERLNEVQNHIVETISDAMSNAVVKDVAMEGYAFGSQMANMLGELGGVVKLTLYKLKGLDAGKYPLIVPPTSLKKYVTGKGQGTSKSQILLNVYKKWGAEFTDDNAADSYGLAHIVSGKAKLSYEKEVYDKLNSAEYREK